MNKLDSFFLCPKSGGVLRREGERWVSERGAFPATFDVPWLYREAESALRHWQRKIDDVLLYSHQQIEIVDEQSKKAGLLKSTRDRLAKLKEGHERNIACLNGLLGDWRVDDQPGELSGLERVPRQQSAMAYQATLFRDWVWGRDQIESYADRLEPMLKGRKKVLALGAGACGLPVMLHERIAAEVTVAVDINPLLMLPARRLLRGETLRLVEFPVVPRESRYLFIEHEIKLPGPVPSGFQLLFADAQSLPVKNAVFDALVTSWLFDILPRDFREMARLMNSALEEGATWANIGQLGFDKRDLTQVYRADEVREIVEEAGFQIESWQTEEVPYLQSPFDAVGRQDCVWIFSAKKVKNVKRPPVFDYWPDWIVDSSLPIPVLDELRALKVKTGVYAFVLDQVDGRRSLQEIGKILTQEFALPQAEAQQAVYKFFSDFFEGSVYREF